MQLCKIIMLDDRLQVSTRVQADMLFPKVRIPGILIKYTSICIYTLYKHKSQKKIHLIGGLTHIYFLSLKLYRVSRLFSPGNCPQVGSQNSRNKLIV